MKPTSPRCRARATTSSCSTPRARRSSSRRAMPRLGDRRFGVGRRPDPAGGEEHHAGRGLPLPHLQWRQRRRGRALRQRRALLRALSCRTSGLTDKRHARRDDEHAARTARAGRRPRHGGHEPRRCSSPRAVRRQWPAPGQAARLGGLAAGPWAPLEVAVLSMGNPHAVQRVDDAAAAPVPGAGPAGRDARALPAQGQRRLMQVLSPRASRCALRARRRRDARLRHRGLRRRWWPASGWAGSTRRSTSRHAAAVLTIEWAGGDARCS